MDRKAIVYIITTTLILSFLLVGCKSNSHSNTNTSASVNESIVEVEQYKSAAQENTNAASLLASQVKYRDIETADADCIIKLNGTTANISSGGAVFENGVLTIISAGTYEISGNLSGRIEINAGQEDKVYIILNGVDISCADYSPFVVNQADKVILYMNDNTSNIFTDGDSYSVPDGMTEEDLPTAAIYSDSDLGLSGNGTLIVNANCNDAITSKKDIWINSGNYNLTAADDGIVGKKSIAVKDGNITINANGDGMKSTEDQDTSKGFISIEDGSFTITSGNDGIQAETYLYIKEGTFTMTTGGGSANAEKKQARMDFKNQVTPSVEETGEQESDSYKGLKANIDITVLDGKFNLDCRDDSFHSNHTISLSGGAIEISSGDDAVHADDILVVSDGNITVDISYEGLEAETIIIEGGEILVKSSDDGLNAANGEAEASMNPNDRSNSNCAIYITAGTLYVNADGDGIDSNGLVAMSGGNVAVDGPENDGNGFFDYDTNFTVTGGNLTAAGSSGMMQSISENSGQPGLAVAFDTSYEAGTNVDLKDSSGNIIASITPQKSFSAVMFSNADLLQGEAYDISINNETVKSIVLDSISVIDGDGMMGKQGGSMKGGVPNGRKDGNRRPQDGSEQPEDGTKRSQDSMGQPKSSPLEL